MQDRPHVSLNLNVRGLGQSATLRINQKVRDLRAEGRHVVNMGLGESPFPVPELVVEALRANATKKSYLPVEGLPALRQAVCDYMERTQGVEARPSQVLVGPGSKELLFLLQLCFYGDLIVPSPCWVSYTPQSQIVGHHVLCVDTSAEDGWKVRADDLAALLDEQHDKYRPRLFVLNYPANPTGVSYSATELQAIAAVAREYGVLILSDEIYSGLHHTGDHVSISKYYPEGTIVLNGISKWAGAGGWRLGVFVFPEDLRWLQDAMAAVGSETYTSVSNPIQHAAVTAFGGGLEIEHYLSHARRILARLSDTVCNVLSGVDVEVVRPDGAFYVFPDFGPLRRRLSRRGIKTSQQLADAVLKETGVAMLPGSDFQRPRNELTARMSLVDFDGAAAIARSEHTPLSQDLPDDFLDHAAEDLLTGLGTLAGWLDKRS